MTKGQEQPRRRPLKRLRRLLVGLGLCIALLGGAWLWLNHYANSPARRVAVLLDELRPPRQPSAMEKLLRWLKLERPAVQAKGYKFQEDISRRLVKIGPDAVEPLIDFLRNDPNANVRKVAADALGDLHDHRAVEPLTDALQHDPDAGVRLFAVWALSDIRDNRAVEPLIKAMGDKESTVREAALFTLSSFDDPRVLPGMEAELYGKDERHADAAACLLSLRAERDANSVAALARAVKAGKRTEFTIGFLAYGSRYGNRSLAVEAIGEAIDDPDAHVAELGARNIGRIDDEAVVPILIKTLADERSLVAAAAAESLGGFRGDARALAAVAGALSHKEWIVREIAAAAMGNLADWPQAEALVKLLSDEEEDVRAAAATALGRIGDRRGTRPLIAALKDESLRVRKAAAEALGWIGDSAAADDLVEAMKDDDSGHSAAAALGWIKNPATADSLAQLLGGKRVLVSIEAAIALALMGRPDGTDVLAPWILHSSYDYDNDFTTPTVVCLALLNTPQARKALTGTKNVLAKRCLEVPPVQALAEIFDKDDRDRDLYRLEVVIGLLARINDPAALEALDKFAAEERRDTHLLAAAAARRIRRLNNLPAPAAAATRPACAGK